LTGEFSRAAMLRMRWPYVQRQLDRALDDYGLSTGEQARLRQSLEDAYKAPFAPPNEDSLAGGLANVIAGRICNYFNLAGGGYTVDGACASSLLAVTTACSRLVLGEIDTALAGAVDLSLDPFELVGFARNGAFARKDMRPYDAKAEGFWPGEGAGFLVLMREADAKASQRHIYAVIRGYGISSDGEGGLTRPVREGQMLALSRAYDMTGFGADQVTYFEGHGTGTAVGDPIEIEAIAETRRRHGRWHGWADQGGDGAAPPGHSPGDGGRRTASVLFGLRRPDRACQGEGLAEYRAIAGGCQRNGLRRHQRPCRLGALSCRTARRARRRRAANARQWPGRRAVCVCGGWSRPARNRDRSATRNGSRFVARRVW